jgi:hypothetical protein
MFELQLIAYLAGHARRCIAEMRENPDRGDVAEKVVLIGIFVALAIAIGVIITKAVTGNANHLANQINSAP